MTGKHWYTFLLRERVTHTNSELGDPTSPMVLRMSRVEERDPEYDWQLSYVMARKKGLDPDKKSFNFVLINGLLPYRDRLSELLLNTSPACPHCPAPQPIESALHYFFYCNINSGAGEAVISLVRPYDQTLNHTKALRLEVECDRVYETAAILILSTELQLIHKRRKENRKTSVREVRAELEALCALLGRTKARKLREAGSMVRNQISNFM